MTAAHDIRGAVVDLNRWEEARREEVARMHGECAGWMRRAGRRRGRATTPASEDGARVGATRERWVDVREGESGCEVYDITEW